MQRQDQFAEATKNTWLPIAALTRATTWLAEPTKVIGFIHKSFLLPQTLLPQTVSSTIRACAVQAVTHKRLA